MHPRKPRQMFRPSAVLLIIYEKGAEPDTAGEAGPPQKKRQELQDGEDETDATQNKPFMPSFTSPPMPMRGARKLANFSPTPRVSITSSK